LTLLTSYPEKVFNKSSSINHQSSTAEWRKRMFIDSIEILDELNEKNRSSDDLGFSYLMNLSREDFKRIGKDLSVERFRKRREMVWRKFQMKNGSALGSKSLKLPIEVDW
jgi:hypothetical protein